MGSELTDVELAALLSGLEVVLSRHGVNVCVPVSGAGNSATACEFRVRHTAEEIDSMFGGAPEDVSRLLAAPPRASPTTSTSTPRRP